MLATAFVAGFQGSGPYMTASVTIKHYIAYNLETDIEGVAPAAWCGSPLNAGGNCTLPNDRHSFNAHVSQLDLAETYAPPFEAATSGSSQADAPGAIMCSYNAINGEPACTNKELIGGLLRGKFGFEGVVATDCGALRDATVHHRRYATDAETATAAVRAGVDSNCGSVFPAALPASMDPASKNYTGLTEAELDRGVARLLAARFRLGLFDPHHPDVPAWTLADVDSAQHRELALQAAREGIILLQNGAGADAAHPSAVRLPLSPQRYKRLAVLGPNANASMNLLSGYSGAAPPDLLVSPLDHLGRIWSAAGGSVVYARGCNVSDDRGATPPAVVKAGLDAAVAAASGPDIDAVVLGLGLCGDNYGGGPPREDPTCYTITEAEGVDRTTLTLAPAQLELFRRVVALGKPVAVFLMNAGPVDVTEIKASGVAVVAAGYGGEFGGQATAEVLAGVYNPGGALATTVYTQGYADRTSFHDMSMRGGTSPGNPSGRTYRFLNDPGNVLSLWPFGHGESFTTFALAFAPGAALPRVGVGLDHDVSLAVKLTNTGSVAGDCVVTCYCTADTADAAADPPTPPLSSLFDFARAPAVAPGGSVDLTFTLTAAARSSTGTDGARRQRAAGSKFAVYCKGLGVARTKVKEIVV